MRSQNVNGKGCFYWTKLSPTNVPTANMYAIFYKDPDLPGKEGECVIIDAGVFLDGASLNCKVPDISYITNLRKGNNPLGKFRVVGMVLTHGHEDHIAALPYVVKELGMPKIYGFPFTIELCQLMDNFDSYKSRLNEVKPTDNAVSLGTFFKAYFIRVTHSIPDTTHIVLEIANKFT